jgi:hypothetical protein
MTPITLITFLLSLALVDLRYNMIRSHNHADGPTRLPTWLHRVLYQPSPYQHVMVKDGDQGEVRQDERGRWYYHSKQRKLLRMEVEEAFQIRGAVLVALGVGIAVGTWGSYVAAKVVWLAIRRWTV